MGIDDAAELQATLQALAVVGVPDAETTELFHALAGILQLGRVVDAHDLTAIAGAAFKDLLAPSTISDCNTPSRIERVGAAERQAPAVVTTSVAPLSANQRCAPTANQPCSSGQ